MLISRFSLGIFLLVTLRYSKQSAENDFPADDTEGAVPMGTGTDAALNFLLQGNKFSVQGRHLDAIYMWKNASVLRPDSNVPWNNIANAYMALGLEDEAVDAAQTAFSMKIDYLSSTTFSNVLKKKQRYQEAENVLLAAIEQSLKSKQRYEHPFWSLALLYFEQGDYLEFVKYAQLGFLQRPGECSAGGKNAEACIPDFEDAISRKLYNACARPNFPHLSPT
jgi:tetratricopeptide (TPR) repeat protein